MRAFTEMLVFGENKSSSDGSLVGPRSPTKTLAICVS